MRIPVPRNRLVALTLLGALLTTVVAGGLVVGDNVSLGDHDDAPATDAPHTASADSPTPNDDFTPAVQTQSGHEEEEEHEYHEDDEEEDDD